MGPAELKEVCDKVYAILHDHDGNKAGRISAIPGVTATELEVARAYRRYREKGGLLRFVTDITKEI